MATGKYKGMDMFMIGFLFSHQRSPNIVLCTTGSTIRNYCYNAKFEEDNVVGRRAVPRAKILNEAMFDLLGIDMHNNHR